MAKPITDRMHSRPIRAQPTFKQARDAGYDVTPKEYRRAYQRWKAAIKRLSNKELLFEPFLLKKRMQFKVGRPRAYYHALRNVEQAIATPKWVDRDALAWFYAKRPKGFQVDHIVPIRGENVSGLHVPWNLQYLESKDNRAKSNLYFAQKFDIADHKLIALIKNLIKEHI